MSLLIEHRPLTSILHPTLFWALLSSCFQLLFILFMSASNSQSIVSISSSLFSFPFRMLHDAVWWFPQCVSYPLPTSFLISISVRTRLVLSHSRLSPMVFDQRTFSILNRKLFTNTCIFLMMVVVVSHVSDPYSRTDCLHVRIEDSHFDIGWELFGVPYVLQL